MTPAPMTIIVLGTRSRTGAPVEETTTFSSMVTFGSGMTSEPVASTMALVASTVVVPSSAVTPTWPTPVMRPMPSNVSTLFFLNRNDTPLTLAETVSSRCLPMAAQSSSGLGVTMPRAAKSWCAVSNISLAYSSALEGMQPMLRQVPPKVLRFSTTATFNPS